MKTKEIKRTIDFYHEIKMGEISTIKQGKDRYVYYNNLDYLNCCERNDMTVRDIILFLDLF